ncbi:MAG: hypothetical protein KC635_19560 [Myxococcales bacterium]|nr:hypothetical protein [Myxococcales bacterium]MCB9734685.1 hypothetical protein [Deltaproteobacteria bacterium]
MRISSSRLAATLGLALTLTLTTAAGCNEATTDDSEDAVAVSSAALESEGDGQALGTLVFSTDVVAQLPATAQERVAAAKAWIEARLTCAEVTASGGILDLTFSRDCAWAGRRWTGAIHVEYGADGSSASLSMSGLAVDGATMTGTLEIDRVADKHLMIAADWQTTRASGRQVNGSWDAEYTWDDTAYTIVSAVHEVDVDGRTATLTKSGVHWVRTAYAPDSGTVTFSGFRGNTWTMTYATNADGDTVVTITGPRGNVRVYVVDGSGAVRRQAAAS